MRKILIILALAAGTVSLAGWRDAEAQDCRWCLQGRQTGYPGDCNYQTRAQCM
ncbi:DUF3551 domain-containing protein, partial [Acinetobacter baumannii]